MQKNDRLYFHERARQERETAQRCADSSARIVHLELAERYRRLAQTEMAQA